MSAIEQPAPRSGRITLHDSAVRMSADSAMKCTPQKMTYSAFFLIGGLAGKLEAVAGEIGELDDGVLLIVVAEDDQLRPNVPRGDSMRSRNSGSESWV